MKTILDQLQQRISVVMRQVSKRDDCDAIVQQTTDARFGDYQANGIMALAKKIKTSPRQLAERVVEKLDLSDICQEPEVAGPGFINLRLKTDFLARKLLRIHTDSTSRLGIEQSDKPKTIVVDFSGPNIAKQMHVGHLRSTIIGDCICRMLEFLGHDVIPQNHIGDWGTQFGMLAYYIDYKKIKIDESYRKKGISRQRAFTAKDLIPDIENFYREAKKLFDANADFADKSRQYVVKLHSGDKHVLFNWEMIVNESCKQFEKIYKILRINLNKESVSGESFYNPMLGDVVKELKDKNLATESEGAICVFPEGFKNKQGESLPLIIQKSDGAYLYATTDLAALKYRIERLEADRIIYVTDSRQKLHFEMLFAVARMAGWVSDNIELSHVMFGSVLGEDGKPLKTREGQNVKLKELLDEAVERAMAVVEEKNPGLSAKKKDEISKAVGIGAVKYADYSNNRTSDYIFSFGKMLAMEGNTAPYMQYAYARIKSIERKAGRNHIDVKAELGRIRKVELTEAAEIELAKHLVRYDEALEAATADFRPNYLTGYLYELSQRFSVFYTNCPVIKSEAKKRPTRFQLCDLTAKTIRHGLKQFLGIDVVEQM